MAPAVDRALVAAVAPDVAVAALGPDEQAPTSATAASPTAYLPTACLVIGDDIDILPARLVSPAPKSPMGVSVPPQGEASGRFGR
ncbi:MAG: hypothetical protein IPI13_15750 [Actinomycetales bacterium]|uniref:Uncharacterized protein n=1 Tax=Candidatus Phosphoribacter hodrii TaxID=2953743 RepID=A0A935IQ14_9MICO|nr:hypothetical protein [Candidatus Phosphoribacter hodrii]